MKLASYRYAGQAAYGAVVGDGIVDLARRCPHPTLRDALAADALPTFAKLLHGATADHRLADVTLLTPIPDARKIICIGRNYRGHVAEGGLKLPDFPSVFLRLHESLVFPGQSIVRPAASNHFDFEGEMALVIGHAGRHILREDALSHIAGYTCFMDGSIRDYQFQHCLTVGKNFAATGSMGPFLVTSDDIPDPTALELVTRLNGEQMQRTRTDDLIFDIPEIIRYVSVFIPLEPGDVIATGTPDGVGFARSPPRWLRPGDTLDVEISHIGVLRNTIVQEAAI